jgi:Tfp pilus assembly protein PilO
MNYTTRRNISLLLAAGLLLAAVIVFFALDMPVFREIGDTNDKIAQEQAQYDEQFQAVQTAKSIINQYRGLASVSQAISLSVPRGAEIENIISQLNNIAAQSGLEVQGVNFETPSLPTIKGGSQANLAEKNKILRISLTLIGSYESFKVWLSSVETNIRLMDVGDISFSSLGGDDQSANRFNFKVTLDTYYQ